VYDDKNANDWGEFWYCQEAIKSDIKSRLNVKILTASGHKNKIKKFFILRDDFSLQEVFGERIEIEDIPCFVHKDESIWGNSWVVSHLETGCRIESHYHRTRAIKLAGWKLRERIKELPSVVEEIKKEVNFPVNDSGTE